MQIEFTKNVGSVDAKAHGLDFKDCWQGMSMEVDEATGVSLVRRRLARELPEIVQAVPSRPSIAEAKEPEIRTVPKQTKSHKES